MKRTLIALIITIITSTTITTEAKTKVEMSNETFYCHTDFGENLKLVIPIPKNTPKETLDKIGNDVCNSIEKAHFSRTAKCDTDYNCEVLYDQFKHRGIIGVYDADEKWQTNNILTKDGAILNRVVEVHCEDGRIKLANSSIPMELKHMCTPPKKAIKEVAKESTGALKNIPISLDWKELTAAVKMGYTTYDSQHNMSPTIEEFITFMKEHRGMSAIGHMTIAENIKKEHSLDIDGIWARFGNKYRIPKWFLEFCEDSDTNPINSVENTPGWMCIWD